MKNQYWTLCDKSEDCVSKCPYAEHHWYQQQGYIVGGQYICFLPDMEDCPYYQKKQYEKTSAPAQLKSDLEYDEKFKPEETCAQCGHFDDTGLLQCWCKEIQRYSHRKNNPCEAFIERTKYNTDIKPFKGKLNECWWCDYHKKSSLGGKKKCQLLHPDIRDGVCHSIKSTGANQ